MREVWIVCHGYAQLAGRFLRAFAPIADPSRLIVAPEALNRYYTDGRIAPHTADSEVAATWMTREDRLHEIEDYVRYLDLLYAEVMHGLDRAQVAVVAFGFSQGAATIARWAARTACATDHVVLWGALLPPELELEGRTPFGDARLTIAAGDHDAAIKPERLSDERVRLQRAGVAHEILEYPGGHRIEADGLRRLAEGIRRAGTTT